MKVAQQLKKRDKSLRTIYVATDSQTVIDEITAYEEEGQYTEWKFVINTKARRIKMKDAPDSKDQFDWEWMFQGNIDPYSVLLDLVFFKEANFIVGSQTSNVFRMATALNFFHHDGDQKRAFEIDHVPWAAGSAVEPDG